MPPEVEQEVKAPVGSVEGRLGVTVVTQENFNDYVNEKLGVVENIDPEAEAAKEFEELEAKQAEQKAAESVPKDGTVEGAKVWWKGKLVSKHDFNYRLHVKTEEAKAELQSKIDAAALEAKTAKEAAEQAAKERDELKAKYEPPPSLEVGPEPNEADYTDMAKFKADLKKWASDSARAEDAKARIEQETKEAQAKAVKLWNERQTKTQAEIPDYAEKVGNSAVKVSDEIRDAIIESEVGPKILYHFAEHPEVAESLGKMTVKKMLVEFGKLEASLSKPIEQQTTQKTSSIAEISKAPAPITPLKGGHAVDGLKFDANGNWTGTPAEWKAARLAGKIK